MPNSLVCQVQPQSQAPPSLKCRLSQTCTCNCVLVKLGLPEPSAASDAIWPLSHSSAHAFGVCIWNLHLQHAFRNGARGAVHSTAGGEQAASPAESIQVHRCRKARSLDGLLRTWMMHHLCCYGRRSCTFLCGALPHTHACCAAATGNAGVHRLTRLCSPCRSTRQPPRVTLAAALDHIAAPAAQPSQCSRRTLLAGAAATATVLGGANQPATAAVAAAAQTATGQAAGASALQSSAAAAPAWEPAFSANSAAAARPLWELADASGNIKQAPQETSELLPSSEIEKFTSFQTRVSVASLPHHMLAACMARMTGQVEAAQREHPVAACAHQLTAGRDRTGAGAQSAHTAAECGADWLPRFCPRGLQCEGAVCLSPLHCQPLPLVCHKRRSGNVKVSGGADTDRLCHLPTK